MKTNLLPWQTDVDEHSGGWFVLRDCDGDEIGSGDGGYEEQDARRIVACVNACAGIPTIDLELDNVLFTEALRERISLKKQRDELLAALKAVRFYVIGEALPTKQQAIELIDAAISKADLTQ